ncbi:hypothetical protein E2C01_012188 [Portunus trituberculatus]|uniref:Uncharacterized protein n=1 Tax=Portunus trituberculatus TaxID=210409 RepID=A0A5B7DDY4_PORTR|nr:hypothetical protein [Portunus trituberculatus]
MATDCTTTITAAASSATANTGMEILLMPLNIRAYLAPQLIAFTVTVFRRVFAWSGCVVCVVAAAGWALGVVWEMPGPGRGCQDFKKINCKRHLCELQPRRHDSLLQPPITSFLPRAVLSLRTAMQVKRAGCVSPPRPHTDKERVKLTEAGYGNAHCPRPPEGHRSASFPASSKYRERGMRVRKPRPQHNGAGGRWALHHNKGWLRVGRGAAWGESCVREGLGGRVKARPSCGGPVVVVLVLVILVVVLVVVVIFSTLKLAFIKVERK